MSGRIDIRAAGAEAGERKRMLNRLLFHYFVVTDQARQDWQTRGIRRCPPSLSERVRRQVKDGSRVGLPTFRVREHVDYLIQFPVVPVEDKDVSIPLAVVPSLDRGIGRDWIR